MSAADKREELEAAVWRTAGDMRISTPDRVLLAMEAADAYANAVADERIAGRVHDRTIGRERLAELDAAVRGGS